MVLTGNSMGIAVKFGINTTLVVFIPNFTATHAITSTNYVMKLTVPATCIILHTSRLHLLATSG